MSAFNADGSMKPLNKTFEQLANAMTSFSDIQKMDAFSNIFGEHQLESANALLTNYGERWQYLTDNINHSEGAMKKMSDTMNDNLKGDIADMGAVLKELGIAVGESFSDTVQRATEAFLQMNSGIEAGQMSKRLEEISTAFGALISRVTDFALSSALPATINGFEWILTHGETIKNVIIGIDTAFVTWKVAKIVVDIKKL